MAAQVLLAIGAAAGHASPAAQSTPVSGSTAAWVEAASQGLDPRALAALAGMPDDSRRLLAVRGYLRAGASLPERWSWSAGQIAAFPGSEQGKAAAADIDAVAAAFAAANPGYVLEANREPRSVELQLARWNSNPSVARTASDLVTAMSARLKETTRATSSVDATSIRAALLAWSPPSAATLAVPGLSAHGQGRAFDFRVMKGSVTIAGTEAASARSRWDDAGWTRKLRDAVMAAGDRFTGPLVSPYEPWHYAWVPRASNAMPPAANDSSRR